MVNLNSLNTAPLVTKPRRQPDGSWKVDSRSRTLVAHTVRNYGFGLECSCERYYYGKPDCYHMQAVLAELRREDEEKSKPTLESLYDI